MEININKLNYNQLLNFASSENFYNVVNSEKKLIEFVNCVHSEYCKTININSIKIKFAPLSEGVWGEWSRKIIPQIKINKCILDCFNECKEKNNTFLPLRIIQIVTHETRHAWQYKNFKNLNTDKLSPSENLAVASICRLQDIIIDYNKKVKKANKVYKKPNGDIEMLKFNLDKNLNDIAAEFGYGYAPHELDANEQVFKALNKILASSKSKNTEANVRVLKKEVISHVRNSASFMDEELESLKEKGGKSEVISAYESALKDYKAKQIEQIYKNKNYDFTLSDYVLNLFPTIKPEVYNPKNIDNDKNIGNEPFKDAALFMMAVIKANRPNNIKKR